MKLIRVLAAAIVLSACISSTVFAGTWKKNDIGYWYENEDGTYLQNRAKAIDGNHLTVSSFHKTYRRICFSL